MSALDKPLASAFVAELGFEPDDFQREAIEAIDDGHNVIVAAPTGAGKTVAAEFAVAKALDERRRLFYTTPIKALSNQKYHDLARRHGYDKVGLLTGDNNINGEAPIVVMTTEVLRNMLYAGQPLDGLQSVVLDEVHYLQDAYRGPVWEEVIIHLRRSVRLVCLSATVSNAEELRDWIKAVRGSTRLVVEQRRPVELTSFYLVADRNGSHINTLRVLHGSKANQKGFRFDGGPGGRGRRRSGPDKQKSGRRKSYRTPRRSEVVQQLARADQLPAIYFIFSRAGCDEAAGSIVDSGQSFTTKAERQRIRHIVEAHVGDLDADELGVLGYERFRSGLEVGVAPHHAGMIPPFKEAVERCFIEGLVKVVFATETLALGINMPARSVVLEKLTKFTGEHHEFLTPAQFTQLTGRAGRRGIDSHGNAFVLWSPYVQFEQIADLVSSKEFVLRSSFRPTYNMAANLVRRYQEDRAHQLLNQSFAQFRIDAGVVTAERRIESLLERKRKLIGELEADFGPIDDLRGAGTSGGRSGDDEADSIAFALGHLNPGDIIRPRNAELPDRLVVVAVSYRRKNQVKVKGVSADADVHEFTAQQLEVEPETVGRVDLPEPYLPNSVSFLHQVGRSLATARSNGNSKSKRRRRPDPDPRSQPIPEEARRGLRRLARIERDLARQQSSTRDRGDSLADQFRRVTDLLSGRGYLDGWSLTAAGTQLARLYHECDLLIVDALEDELFDGLTSAETAALASVFVFEERRSNRGGGDTRYPSDRVRRRFRRVQALHLNLSLDEDEFRLPQTREPDPGFMAIAHAWADGADLSDVLDVDELTAGDFVRTAKQLVDLLRQLALIAPEATTQAACRSAADGIHRGLVASSSVGAGEEETG